MSSTACNANTTSPPSSKNELPPHSPEETIKAQIIAAKSYALATAFQRRKQGKMYDLKITQSDQVYSHSLDEDPHVARLIKKLQHEYLSHRSQILKSYYHACSGGLSETPLNAWGETQQNQAYQIKLSPLDQKVSLCRWRFRIHKDYGQLLNVGRIQSIAITKKTSGQRVKQVTLKGNSKTLVLSDKQLLSRLGGLNVRSFLFDIKRHSHSWLFQGNGWGHGVGLSQHGAIAMAKAGLDYQAILRFYYPGAQLKVFLPEKYNSSN